MHICCQSVLSFLQRKVAIKCKQLHCFVMIQAQWSWQKNPIVNTTAKHIEVHDYYIIEFIQNRVIKFVHCKSKDKFAYYLWKH